MKYRMGFMIWAVAAMANATVYVDLSSVVNTAREDDGISGNQEGGWSDEGINDMYVYPPIPIGEVERNAHRFFLLDPEAHPQGHVVLMLQGQLRGQDKPEQVELAVPPTRARYLYVLQNAVGPVPAQPDHVQLGVWTVGFEDGSEMDIPIRANLEMRSWWTSQWWDNHGASAWPIFMGRNVYTMKWNQYIGIWSMQWINPHPDKLINRLRFRSEGLDAPVIWAVTLSDDNFYADEALFKSHFARPDAPPAGFFSVKEAQERIGIVKAAAAEGRLQGIRSVQPIRPDLIRVVTDSALGGVGAGPGNELLQPWMAASHWSILESDGTQPLAILEVGRHSFDAWRGDIGYFPANELFHHAFYLRLARPMEQGRSYTVQVKDLPAPFRSEAILAFNDRAVENPALKVNQVAYFGGAGARYAYLGWWAGSLGMVDFTGHTAYEVLNATGKIMVRGEAALRNDLDDRSGEQVWEMDLSNVPNGGPYRVHVPGIGVSAPFRIGQEGVKELYYHTSRAFFHQRCGHALGAPHTWIEREACHLHVYESGFMVGNPLYAPRPDEPVREFIGGYHDAGDDDCFTYHLRATAQWLAAYEQYPGRFKDKDLNIPKSGNGIPDLLDEAWWALEFYLNAQQSDGGIPLGRGNDQDYIREWERKHKSRPTFGIFPPTHNSSMEFAATAAHLARLLKPHNPDRADALLQSAERAYAWARAQENAPEDVNNKLFEAWAAGELFETTGKEEYHTHFLAMTEAEAFKRAHWRMSQYVLIFYWAYARSDRPEINKDVQASLRQDIIRRADNVVKNTSETAYRMGHNGKTGLGWGNGHGGGHYADVCLRAFWLTRNPAYLDTASLNADFQLGANPLSKTFVTGMGSRPPVQPQISPALYEEPRKTGRTVEGISIYGLSGNQPPGYPSEFPLYRRWRDIGGSAEISSEFTITETIGASAMLYSTLYAESAAE